MTNQLGEPPNKTEEKEMTDYGSEETKINPSDYDCQILLEKTTIGIANDKSFPMELSIQDSGVTNQKEKRRRKENE